MNKAQLLNLTIQRLCNSGGDGIVLPPEYQRVEWIENGGTGRCYIYIGTAVYDTYYYKIGFEFVDQIGGAILGRDGAENAANQYPVATVAFGTSYGDLVLFKKHKATIPSITAGTKYTIEYYYDGSYKAILNNQSLTVTSDSNTDNPALVLFFSTFGKYCRPCKLYDVTIKDSYNGADLCKLVPCYRKSDSKPGMYNVVTDTFYAGSVSSTNPGTYILGNNV